MLKNNDTPSPCQHTEKGSTAKCFHCRFPMRPRPSSIHDRPFAILSQIVTFDSEGQMERPAYRVIVHGAR